MTRRLLQLMVACALILAVGAHWAVLQSVAWAGMVIAYSQNASLAEALQKTFDGDHPCKLCKAVDEGRKSEQRQTLLKLDTKIDFYLERPVTFVLPPAGERRFTAPDTIATRWLEPPPTPPPLRG